MTTNGSTPRLYVILGSHACRTGILLLEHKGIRYRRVELFTGLHPFGVRLRGFPAKDPARRVDDGPHPLLGMANRLGTVPALRVGRDRIQTNREIARFLERTQPEPPLFPADVDERREVEEAERWGDEVFQMVARRLTLAAALHGPDAVRDRGNQGRLGPLLWRHDRMRQLGVRAVGRFAFGATPESEGRLLDALPAALDRIDAWIGAGVLNGRALNAADYMIVTSLALLTYRRDLAPAIESRPAGGLVDRGLPEPSSGS